MERTSSSRSGRKLSPARTSEISPPPSSTATQQSHVESLSDSELDAMIEQIKAQMNEVAQKLRFDRKKILEKIKIKLQTFDLKVCLKKVVYSALRLSIRLFRFIQKTVNELKSCDQEKMEAFLTASSHKVRQIGPTMIFTVVVIFALLLNTLSTAANLEHFLTRNEHKIEMMNVPRNPKSNARMDLIQQRAKGEIDTSAKARKNAHVAVKRKLPQPFKSGGIIYFVHIPGTDGHLIRDFLSSRTIYVVARRIGQYKKMAVQIENLIQSGELNGQIYAFETHGSTVPPYVDISEKVKEWKVASAAVEDVPFFTFTIMKEPTALQLSSFNHYYLGRKVLLANDTADDFVQTLLNDPQCEFLARGGGFHSMLDGFVRKDEVLNELNRGFTDEECDRAYGDLFEDMDWIGTTEKMKSEMLPLLNYLTGSGDIPELEYKEAPAKMTLERLSKAHLERLEHSTRRDKKWYKAAQVAFRFDSWNATVMAAQSRRRRLSLRG